MQSTKIVVVGESGVGKSSLIAALVSDTHRELLNAKELTPIQLPGVDGGPPTTILDTGGVACDKDHRLSKDLWDERSKRCVQDSDAIVIVASCIHIPSIKNILDLTKRLDETIPVTVAINFCEYQLEKEPNQFLDFDPLAKQGFNRISFGKWINGAFREKLEMIENCRRIENVVLCSAATLTGVKDVFLKVIQSVLYPIAPLWDWEENNFTKKYLAILHRVWNVARVKNNTLNFQDFYWYQSFSFKFLISVHDFALIAQELQKKNNDFVENDGKNITLLGFLELHKVLILKGNRKAIWRKLMAMGYTLDNGEIKFRDDYYPSFEESANVRYEWTPVILDWLKKIFDDYDGGAKGFLHNEELRVLLRPFPDGVFFALNEEFPKLEARDQRFTKNAWLTLWALSAHKTPKKALEDLVFLGYPIRETSIGKLDQYLITKRPRSSDLSLFKCVVLGSDKMNKNIDLLHCLKRGELTPEENECANILPKSQRIAHFELFSLFSNNGNYEARLKVDDVCICFADLNCVSLVQKVIEKCVANRTPLIIVIEKKKEYWGYDQKELSNKLEEWRKDFHIREELTWDKEDSLKTLRDLDKRFGELEKHVPYKGVPYLTWRNAFGLALVIGVVGLLPKLLKLSTDSVAKAEEPSIPEEPPIPVEPST